MVFTRILICCLCCYSKRQHSNHRNIYIIKQITSSESSEDPNVEITSSSDTQNEEQTTKPKEADTDEPQVKDEIPDESSGDNTAEINTLITTPNE